MSVDNRQCSFYNAGSIIFRHSVFQNGLKSNNFNAQKPLLSFSYNTNSIITQFKSKRESRTFKIRNLNADSRKLNFFME
jgi:hypothetical protein